MICIVGPSGCGKSTILNLVAGLLTPEAGHIDFGGATRAAIASHHIGYMLARDSLLPWRTARANVELALEIRHKQGVDRNARHARAEELLALVGLEKSGALYPRQLSQGMRQRVAIARTLACDPEIFLMDEPFGALDAQTRRLIHEEFLRIWLISRKSVLFVTHDLMEALVLGDRVIVINGRPGTIVADYSVDIPRDQRMGSGAFAPRLMELHENLWRKLRQS
jgi:NitT/TauT family transport system ATP-binding protein